jgi:uncharacterized protein
MRSTMKFTTALAACALVLAMAGPALARTSYVTDGGAMFSPATVAVLNQQIGDFAQQNGKEVVVITVPTLAGATLPKAVEDTFAREQVNGVLFFFAKAEKQDMVVGDKASKAFFPAGTFGNIHDAMRGYLRSGDPDQAIKTGVSLVLDQYRSHVRAPVSARQTTTNRQLAPSSSGSSFGGGMSLFWLALFLIAGFLIIRAIFRAMAGPRMMPPGYGQGPGMGPGYGPGYGGGGGGFFSGLLGGLGGAWLGNEMFGHQNQNIVNPGSTAGVAGDASSGADQSGWQSDAGQADMGDAGGGSFGDSGGGFDSGGGGDSGGGDSGGW